MGCCTLNHQIDVSTSRVTLRLPLKRNAPKLRSSLLHVTDFMLKFISRCENLSKRVSLHPSYLLSRIYSPRVAAFTDSKIGALGGAKVRSSVSLHFTYPVDV